MPIGQACSRRGGENLSLDLKTLTSRVRVECTYCREEHGLDDSYRFTEKQVPREACLIHHKLGNTSSIFTPVTVHRSTRNGYSSR